MQIKQVKENPLHHSHHLHIAKATPAIHIPHPTNSHHPPPNPRSLIPALINPLVQIAHSSIGTLGLCDHDCGCDCDRVVVVVVMGPGGGYGDVIGGGAGE